MTWELWFYFGLIHESRTVRSFNCIDWGWSKASPPLGMNWGNCRVDQCDPLGQYQEELRSKRYFQARDKPSMFKGVGIDLKTLNANAKALAVRVHCSMHQMAAAAIWGSCSSYFG